MPTLNLYQLRVMKLWKTQIYFHASRIEFNAKCIFNPPHDKNSQGRSCSNIGTAVAARQGGWTLWSKRSVHGGRHREQRKWSGWRIHDAKLELSRHHICNQVIQSTRHLSFPRFPPHNKNPARCSARQLVQTLTMIYFRMLCCMFQWTTGLG